MSVGSLISSGVPRMPVAIAGRIGPVSAMRQALAAYLRAVQFRVHGGTDPRDSVFHLTDVLDRWPRPDEKLRYPCASIVELPGTERDQSLSPSPLEDTLGQFDSLVDCSVGRAPFRTCLWVTGEAIASFQVDLWLDSEADRQAAEGAIDDAFSPEEGRSCVVVQGPDLYYGQSCEFSLESTHHDDSAETATRNERRLRCVVQGSCAIVSLREAIMISTPIAIVDVVSPGDSGEGE